MKKNVIVAVLVVVAGGLGFWFVGRPAYRQHQERRAIEQANAYMAKGDHRNASLSARRALQLNGRNLEACRIMAELNELSRSPSALDWRRRIAETAPTTENKLHLAAAAMRSQGPPFALATQILEEVGKTAQDVAAYHMVAGELAVKLRHAEEAATHFAAASRLDPTNELAQLNLAALHVESTNSDLASSARATLERLRANPGLRSVALRWLIAPALQQGDLAAAEQYSRELIADSQARLEDRLQHLNILREIKSPDATGYLSAVKQGAATNAVQAYDMSVWMISHGMVDEDLHWLTNLVAGVRNEQPVPLAVVDCYLAKKDWGALQTFLDSQKWGELEFLRLAFLSRAAEEQRQNLAMDLRWRSAVREAGDRLGPLTKLLALAGSWGRDRAYEDLLWQLAQHFPRQRAIFFRELERRYVAADNTSGLNKLAAAKLSYDTRDFRAQNDLAATSLLLRLNLPRAHELAKEAYSQHPEEAVVASTYAYSLQMQRRAKEGLEVLDKLKPEERQSPPVALYYGVLLAATGETNQAAKYLEIAEHSRMLPEEKILLAEARK